MRENGFAPVPVILIVDDQPTDTLLLQEAVADLGGSTRPTTETRRWSWPLPIART
ncbi:hypothetical protein ULG90_20710 [Halopseudomonas pachastrellae]|nr:hypothetical protein ULG90_20710 [Halopseudomonas pachastrellae]